MKHLVSFLVQYDVPLTSLGLVNMQLTEESMVLLAKYVDKSFSLQHLDVAWNELSTKNFRPLIEAISSNKLLKSLNLSNNTLVDVKY